MKYFLGTILNVAIWVIVAVVLFLVGCGLWQRVVNKDGYTGFLGVGYAVVVSGSMIPALQIDDMIIYQEHEKEDYAVGDIIVYVRDKGTEDEMLITHRIKTLEPTTLVTRGDANTRDDKPISYEQVVGKVVWRVPGVGKAVSFLRKPIGLLLVLAVAVGLVALNLFLTFSRRRRRKVKTSFGDQYISY